VNSATRQAEPAKGAGDVASGLGRAVLALTERSPVRKLFTATRPGRSLSTRFVAGESLAAAIEVALEINSTGATVSLDHLGEHVTDADQAQRARDDYLECLDALDAAGIDGNISVKLTQLGLGFDDALAARSLEALAERAGRYGHTVTIDMEESAHTDTTVALFEHVQVGHGNLGIALQAYLHRTPDDLARVIAAGGHVRLCKGAYAEPATIAHQTRAKVDAAFDALLGVLMVAPTVYPAIATHDEARVAEAARLGEGRAGPWEFQMLYGVRRALQEEVLAKAHRLRVYVPYGEAWYPYLTRRLAERPANLWFFLRAASSPRR
jgi:proline dehydrogenase